MENEKSSVGTKDGRARNWTFIVYPDSAPGNWKSMLDEMNLPWIESPLHDADMNAAGIEKKPHWHVAVVFTGSKSFEQVKQITMEVNATIPVPVKDMRALTRYMAHLDDPNKKQYDPILIIGHGGVDVQSYMARTSAERHELIREMMVWVYDTQCTEMFMLVNYAMSERLTDWFPLLCDNCAYIMGEYIKSIRNYVKMHQA
jgi:hypothetical protein